MMAHGTKWWVLRHFWSSVNMITDSESLLDFCLSLYVYIDNCLYILDTLSLSKRKKSQEFLVQEAGDIIKLIDTCFAHGQPEFNFWHHIWSPDL